GSRSQRATRSRLTLPTTATLGGKRAQVVHGLAEQVLAQVEQARPERAAVGRRADPGRVREALQRADEDGELEVRLGDTRRRDLHARASEDRLPFDQLGGTRPPVPRPALCDLRLAP